MGRSRAPVGGPGPGAHGDHTHPKIRTGVAPGRFDDLVTHLTNQFTAVLDDDEHIVTRGVATAVGAKTFEIYGVHRRNRAVLLG